MSQLIGKRCGRCGGALSLSAGVGSRCPHCGVYFGGVETQYVDGGTSTGGGDDAAGGCAGCLVILVIIGIIWGIVQCSQKDDQPSTPSTPPPAVDYTTSPPPDVKVETPSPDPVPPSELPSELPAAEPSDTEPAPPEEMPGDLSLPGQAMPGGYFSPSATMSPYGEPSASATELSAAAPSGETSPTTPLAGASEPRTWWDDKGTHQIDATFLGVSGNTVRLRTTRGREIDVPLERLSAEDPGLGGCAPLTLLKRQDRQLVFVAQSMPPG